MARKYQLHGAFPSKAGDSAYEVALKNGFEGTEQEWLDSLVGPPGQHGIGESAYEVALKNGFEGTEQEWLDSLVGPPGQHGTGDSAYEVALKNGFEGTEQEWLDSLVGPEGPTGATFRITMVLTEDVSNVVLKMPVKWGKIVQFNLNCIPKLSGESKVEMYNGGMNYKVIGTLSSNTKAFDIYGVRYYTTQLSAPIFSVSIQVADNAEDAVRPQFGGHTVAVHPDFDEISMYTTVSGVVFQAGTRFEMWGVYAP
jgi:hypothetical protein